MGRVLVTGGSGAIGSFVIRRLVAEHAEEPVVFDNRLDDTLLRDLAGRYVPVAGDIRNLSDLLRAVADHDIDRIVHLAVFLPPQEAAHPVTAFQVNANGTQNVLEAAVIGRLRRVVYTSSKGVFGSFTGDYGAPAFKPMTEDLPKAPVGMYDLTKLTGEYLCDFYRRSYGVDTITLRFPVLYGPGRIARHGIVSTVSRLVENALAGIPTEMEHGADWADELLYTRDVAQGIVRALYAESTEHRTFHIGRCQVSTLREVATAIRRVIPDAVIELGPGTFRDEPRACRFDYSRARSDLGYEPEFDLESGIADYIAFMREHQIRPLSA